MRLTIIAPDNVYEHEVDPSMDIQDVQALIEAETGLPTSSQLLSSDAGVPLTAGSRSLESYGLTGGNTTIFLTFKSQQIRASSSSAASVDAEYERMRLQVLGDPNLMAQLRKNDPEMASAIEGSTQMFRQVMQSQQRRQREAALEKERQIELLNEDPYDMEAQKKIEEAIRMEAVLENLSHAMEYSPESFGNVTMLYIDVEVNGHKVKAFVDSGAQTTIISPECAEACGIMRLIDRRFAGVAMGVGTANILGRIHSAQIKLGHLHLPVSFSVLEGQSVDLLFGLDMLKRHQACIDLSTNTLRIGDVDIPFLSEHELPDKARRHVQQELAHEMGSAASQGVQAGIASPPEAQKNNHDSSQSLEGGSGIASGSRSTLESVLEKQTRGTFTPSPLGSALEADIQTLVNLGAPREHAIQLLDASGGNVDVAASMLFG